MSLWQREYNELKTMLEKLGWQCLTDKMSGVEEWYSQGTLYANFTKKGKGIHIEYGDEDNVFGEG